MFSYDKRTYCTCDYGNYMDETVFSLLLDGKPTGFTRKCGGGPVTAESYDKQAAEKEAVEREVEQVIGQLNARLARP